MTVLSRFTFAISIAFLVCPIVWAQTETGQIRGLVTDPSGAIVPNAKVTVESTSTGAQRETTGTASGVYALPNLPPGTYEMTVAASGFSRWMTRVTVPVGTRVGVDVHLVVGSMETVIEVTDAANQVNTETQTLGVTVNSAQIQDLPSLTRNPYDFVSLAGNISDDDASGRGTGYAINGQRSASTGVLLDGIGNTDDFAAIVGLAVPLDSVQEFSILTSNFTAEFGRASGGIVNVATKGGSNDLHGTLFEFNRFSRLSANTFSNNAYEIDKPIFTRNQFGGSAGGPAIKDKLFFFGNIEWIRIRGQATETAWVPAPQLIQASAPATRDTFAKIGKLKGGLVNQTLLTKAGWLAAGGSCPDATGLCAQLHANTPMWQQVSYNIPADSGAGAPQNTYRLFGRTDWNIDTKTQLSYRFARESQDFFNGSWSNSPYAGFDTGITLNNNSHVLSIVRTISPTIVSQSKLNYNRFQNEQPLGEAGIVPTILLGGGLTSILGSPLALPGHFPFAPGAALPFGGPENFIAYNQDLSLLRGSHGFRVGGGFTYIQDNRTFGAFQQGLMYLGPTVPWGVENLLAGQAFVFQVAIDSQGKLPCKDQANPDPTCTITLPATAPSFSRSNRYKEFSLYSQDAWKATRRLTLNLGLRYEYFGVQHASRPELESNFFPAQMGNIYLSIRNGEVATTPTSPNGGLWAPDYNNFAPRLGFAYDLSGDGNTSIRGGYGMGYERNFGNVTFNVIQNPPSQAVIYLIAGVDVPSMSITADNYGPMSGTSGSKGIPRTSLRNVDGNIRTAYAHFWSLAIERQFGKGFVGAIEYSGSAGRKLYSVEDLNRLGYGNVYLGDTCNYGVSGACTSRLNNRYSRLNWRGNKGFSDYHGVNFRLNINNFANSGVSLTANYTVSKALDNLSDTLSQSPNKHDFNFGMLDPWNPRLDRGLADFDMRHRLVVGGVLDLPFGRLGKDPSLSKLVGGWQFAPLMTVRSGSPYSIYDCSNSNEVPYYCARAQFDGPVPATPGRDAVATEIPNNFNYLDLSSLPISSGWANPITGTSVVGPFPSNMSGRNSFAGPGQFSFDAGIYKNIQINERFKLQFRSEWYSMFNHPNLRLIGYDADVSYSPYISGTKGGDAGEDRRNIQFALKLIF